jgi:hypothetical protein
MRATRSIPTAPTEFDGTVAEFVDLHMEGVLPQRAEVAYWHERLLEFAASGEPLPVRYTSDQERGVTCISATGAAVKPTDNSPAWWMHFVCFNGIRDARLQDVPSHMFEVAREMRANVSTAGWHVAHILDAKDRNTNWRSWSHADVVRRFLRNIHPCNCFYLPKPQWRRYGGDAAIIGYIAARYAERYRTTWTDFLGRAGGVSPLCGDGRVRLVISPALDPVPAPILDGGDPTIAASYRFSRLAFRSDVIERLGAHDIFEVITPNGRFRMTKSDFRRTFPNVIASKSYRERGLYHYSRLPRAALQFLLPE